MIPKIIRVFLVLFAASAATAGPVYYSGTGHWYEAVLVPAGITWSSARSAALAAGGYLATVDANGASPQDENQFIFSLIDSDSYWNHEWYSVGPWLGGYQAAGALEPSGGWSWADRALETLAMSGPGQFWRFAEPNNYLGLDEAYLHFYADLGGVRVSTWNDAQGTGVLGSHIPFGYVVEWDTEPGVPEPATVWLFVSGILLVGWRERSRRRY